MSNEENIMCTCESLAYYGDKFLMLKVDPECKQHGRKKSDQSKHAERVTLLGLFAKIMSTEWIPSSKVSADYFATYVMENGEEGYFYARKAVP